MNVSELACEALSHSVCLKITSKGFSRIVEVHALGLTPEGRESLYVWQVCVTATCEQESNGWKVLPCDEIVDCELTEWRSLAPRLGYKPKDIPFSMVRLQY